MGPNDPEEEEIDSAQVNSNPSSQQGETSQPEQPQPVFPNLDPKSIQIQSPVRQTSDQPISNQHANVNQLTEQLEQLNPFSPQPHPEFDDPVDEPELVISEEKIAHRR